MATYSIKCWICKEWSNTHGHNAQPLCKGNREKLVCASCNQEYVMASRKVLWEMGRDPRRGMTITPPRLEEFRELERVRRFDEDYSVWPKNRDVDSDDESEEEQVVEKSAPTRETKQTKSQSKRAM